MSSTTKMKKESFAHVSIEPAEIVEWARLVKQVHLDENEARLFLERHEPQIVASMYGGGWGSIEEAFRSDVK